MRALIPALVMTLAALAGCSSSTGPTADAPVPASTYIPTSETEAHPAKVSIPALKVESNIIDLGLQPDGTMQVPPDAQDTGWYTNSPAPGRPGPAVLAAHVNWKGVDGPFAKIGQLKAGDQVIVESAGEARAEFAVDKVERYPKSAFPTDAIYGDTPDPQLRLVTCGGSFDAAAHSYRDNIVVFAHLVT